MAELLPTWNAVGAEPPAELKTTGWQPGMKPSAQHMNWLFNRIYKCLEEIQAGGGTEELERELAALQFSLTTHLADNEKHVTPQERIGWNAKEDKNNKNKPGGYVGLDANSKINPAQLPDATRLDLEYLKINYSNF
ncbi:hypothetical protein [Psychrobacillus sp. FSL K6-2843]|uniref:hypothetical protein n=1 Tax=Psychrobacillus sp. FSL K6-2843 TaxID=2921549 RepID=UPI00315A2BBF